MLPSGVTATASGQVPTGTVLRTLADATSISDTLSSVQFATKACRPSGVTATASGAFPTVIDWIARGLVDPGLIITHQVDFRDVNGAFDLAERNPRESCKVLLDFGADE